MRNSNVTGACVSQNAHSDMLQRVWAEMDYRLEVHSATKDGDIGHL
jgi:hypothetical protein